MALQIQRIDAVDQLTPEVIEQWRQLPMRSPMQSPDWLLAWWRIYGSRNESDQLCLLAIYEGDHLVAVAPWYFRHNWQNGNCLRFLGDGRTCSDHATVAIGSVSFERVLNVLSHWLRRENGKRWQTIHFESIDDNDEVVRQLVNGLHADGCDVHSQSSVGTCVVDLPTTWDEYVIHLSEANRALCQGWKESFLDTGRVRVISTPQVTAESGWNQLTILNQHRRDSVSELSVYEDARFHEFHLSVLPSLLSHGQAQIRELMVDGQCIAAEYVFVPSRYSFSISKRSSFFGFGRWVWRPIGALFDMRCDTRWHSTN